MSIEEIAPRIEEMACCVRGYHVYKEAAIREVLVRGTEPTNVGNTVYENIFTTKTVKRITVAKETAHDPSSLLVGLNSVVVENGWRVLSAFERTI